MKNRPKLTVLLILIGTLSIWGQAPTQTITTTPPPQAEEKKEEINIIDFTLKNMKNKPEKLSDYLEKGPVLVSFWATWCTPCLLELNDQKPIYEEYHPLGLQILAISTDNSNTQGKIKNIINRYKFPYPILKDPDKRILNMLQGKDMPYSVLFKPDSTILYKHTGYEKGDLNTLITYLDPLLKPTANSTEAVTENIKQKIPESPPITSQENETQP